MAYCSLEKPAKLSAVMVSKNNTKLISSAKCIVLGTRILNVEVTKEQTYSMKLKGISICFSMLKSALCGSYVNFGVFRLYGDEALDNVLNVFVKMLLSISHSDLLVSEMSVLTGEPKSPFLSGLSKIVPDVLFPARVFGPGPHAVLSDNGATCFPVHPHIDL